MRNAIVLLALALVALGGCSNVTGPIDAAKTTVLDAFGKAQLGIDQGAATVNEFGEAGLGYLDNPVTGTVYEPMSGALSGLLKVFQGAGEVVMGIGRGVAATLDLAGGIGKLFEKNDQQAMIEAPWDAPVSALDADLMQAPEWGLPES